jgi:hypothetical protein
MCAARAIYSSAALLVATARESYWVGMLPDIQCCYQIVTSDVCSGGLQ